MTLVTIDTTRTVRRTIRVKGKARKVIYVEVTCDCGVRWFARADKAKHIRSCYQCSQTAKAKKGYAATAAKHGERFALRWLREWRLEHPTCLERIVAAWLDALGIHYEREYYFVTGDNRIRLLDFLVNSQLVIEVNGAYWHQLPGAAERDASKAAAVAYAGFELLVLSEAEITSGEGYTRLANHLA